MVQIHVINLDDSEVTLQAKPGMTLMEVLTDANIEGIEGACGGNCSCATCHVHIADEWWDAIGPRGDMEDDLVSDSDDFDATDSRLGCQIEITDDLDGLQVMVAQPD